MGFISLYVSFPFFFWHYPTKYYQNYTDTIAGKTLDSLFPVNYRYHGIPMVGQNGSRQFSQSGVVFCDKDSLQTTSCRGLFKRFVFLDFSSNVYYRRIDIEGRSFPLFTCNIDIGTDIGAETPEELAVCIVGELIKVRSELRKRVSNRI
jgi:hypothetical protein